VQAEYSDCGANKAIISVYAIEEILAEKLRSLLTRSEPRDLFDVHYLMTHQMADIEAITFNCAPKFEIKGLHMPDLRTVLDRKQKVFKQYWHSRLDGQMSEMPEFDEVVRETGRLLSKYF
jgi:predicted nucleotidyltransferase component of viral defense system